MAKNAKKTKKAKVVKAANKSAKKPAAKVAKKATAKATKKTALPAKKKAPTAKKAAPAKKVAKRQLADWSQVLSPLDDRVLVSIAATIETKTSSGLILLEGSQDQEQCRGTVEAVGRGHLSKKGKIRPLDLQIGDQILFPKFAGAKVTVEGQDLFILREGEVLGVIAPSGK